MMTGDFDRCLKVMFAVFIVQVSFISHSRSSSKLHQSALRYKRQSCSKRLEFQCANGECIPLYNTCDGPKDCSDGSDETNTTCQAMDIHCPSLSFECSYGACIDKVLKCNGEPDCADASDEQNCKANTPVSTCANSQFQCSSGSQCVSRYAICDAVIDCTDGSDETKQLCQEFNCPSSSFQCRYGACLDQSVRCNGRLECPDGSDEATCTPTDNDRPVEVGSCSLPSHPEHGKYVSSQCGAGDLRPACRNTPGDLVPHNWLLKYSCDSGYNISSPMNEYSVCDEGKWNIRLDCIKMCPPLQSLSVDVRCEREGREVSCVLPMRPDTTATPRCKQHYVQTFRPPYARLTCQQDGNWNYPLFYCTPDCGVSIKAEPLIVNGTPTVRGEFPWLVGLYTKRLGNGSVGNSWEQVCGGTLISTHIVLTAAHCVVFPNRLYLKPEEIKVGLGKYYRDFSKYEDTSIIADVREIVIQPHYAGQDSFYALDIALLDLATSVTINAFIMPACVDWTKNIFHQGSIGHVAGWGKTDNGSSSEVVLSATLTYIDVAVCIRSVKPIYARLVTHDKYCATKINGTQVNQGDSGGGMTAVWRGQHFVIGVVSTKLRDELLYSMFTNISNPEHFSWLEQHRTRLDSLHLET